MNQKQLRKSVGKTARDVFIYNAIMVIVATGIIIFHAMRASHRGINFLSGQVLNERVLGAGSASIVGVCAGLLFLVWRIRQKGLSREIMREKRAMSGLRFVQLFGFSMACQLLFQVGAIGVEGVLNIWGYTLTGQVESASAISNTLWMFLYTALIGPVAEEIVFRGFVLRSLQSFGNGLAILVSAMLFGVMHGNFVQGVFAVGVGIVFGYVAVEYSIEWSILMHILNNLVFSELLGKMTAGYSEGVQALVNYTVLGIFAVIAIMTAVKEKNRIRDWWRHNRPSGRECLSAFTTGWILIFFLIQFLVAVQGIQKI